MSNIQLVENLYILRKAHNYTQETLGKMLNISRQAYSNYETSKRTPDLDLLIKLSQIYGVTLDQLVNQPYTANGIIREQKGPYAPGMEIGSGDMLYLTAEEVDVIKKYRKIDGEYKIIIDKLLNR
ncbi:helix-turn-helix transcriptional regulator [Faecalicatena contorta]|uniref:DNA-binding transcriptional regulator, XRE-family HTH domain n=1 Tax=Faecalicatena contorta TaxID=39482 RepID=A0A315ZUL2_9FIRM|nr:helix-turn-helix transcriptional regulator [Faecalicatena contorta]PWJ48334.1 DNA-binding XRE family transcriptional regulator [Faecalicatena contorta]SUQ15357.1 DNA-binding transcriptional regulator, XRE-family HTH domain [Faecalicatena contorta]